MFNAEFFTEQINHMKNVCESKSLLDYVICCMCFLSVLNNSSESMDEIIYICIAPNLGVRARVVSMRVNYSNQMKSTYAQSEE